ncbi:MAG: ornithine cyclodeaminase family protein, partial [Clostridia bacterium]|nr:ornithine cyclodeaminase family protein [Clostridia bacterium]
LEEKDVRSLLSAGEGVEIMRKALQGLEEGQYAMPPRLITHMPNTAVFGFMPAWCGGYYGAKVITAYAPNAGTQYPSHIGYVMLFESEHSTVAGLVDATSVTEIRTGCVSAVATDVLARKDARTLALIGAGAQARSHLSAILAVRPITSVTVYDLRPEAAETFAREAREKYGLEVTLAEDVRSCVREADIICTLTPAKEAYLTLDMVKPGTHINAVGTYTPSTREVASDLIAASRLYADQVEAMKRESGEYLVPLKEGLIGEDHIVGSVGEVLLGRKSGRSNDTEITVFDALGLAVEDVATAVYVLEKAQ